jgi:hypothetical protein
VRCAGQPISDIVVRNEPPAISGISRRSRTLARALLSMHFTTRPEVIRRLVVIESGQPCNELRRAESERILRAQPYLAEASIIAYDDGNGGVKLEILTVDELSTIIDVGATASSPYVKRLRFGSSNVGGEAMLIEGLPVRRQAVPAESLRGPTSVRIRVHGNRESHFSDRPAARRVADGRWQTRRIHDLPAAGRRVTRLVHRAALR